MIRKTQNKTTVRYHLTLIRMAAAKHRKRKEENNREGGTKAPMQCWQNGKWSHVYGK